MKQLSIICPKLLVSLVFTISVIAIKAENVTINGVRYSLSGAYAKVCGVDNNNTSTTIVIPSLIMYNGLEYEVNEIGPYAFLYDDCLIVGDVTGETSGTYYGTKYVQNIILPPTIKKIGSCAFNNSRITQIIIPESVADFGYNPFSGCSMLRTIIYLGKEPPSNWVATSYTYVPNIQKYNNPQTSINNARVVEMVTFYPTQYNYTGQFPTVTCTNNVEGYTTSLSVPTNNKDAGNYEEWIPLTFTKGDESFTTNLVFQYTIKPAKLVAKASNERREYGSENPLFNISYSGFINNENESVVTTHPSISTTATKTSDVGDYPITVTGGKATNYSFVYEPGVLTITKAPLLGEVNHAKRTYGSENPTFSIKYYNLRNGETEPVWTVPPTFSTTVTPISDVGTYEVSANGVAKNYDIFINNGTLSVEPAPLTIKANDADRLYYSENPTFNFTCNGFVNGENERVLSNTPTLSTSAKITSKVGAYEIIPSNASSKNYSISYENGTLMIQPRALTASVEDYERVYNEENPTFEVTLAGFVGNENESVVTIKPSATTTATKTSDVGTYPIVVSGGSADNYTFNYTSGTLTINKADQTILWEQDLSHFKVGDQVVLEATSTSGLPVSYAMDSNNVAEIYLVAESTYLDCKAVGQAQVMAVQSGNHNYHSTTRLRRTVTVNDSSTAINELQNEALEEAKIFDMSGTRINNLQKGVNIVRMSDGSVKKVVVK